MAVHLRARIRDVGENARWSQKHIILDHCSGIYPDVILNLDIIADDDVLGYLAVLAEDAALAYLRALQNVGVVPDFRPSADLTRLADHRGRMNEIRLLGRLRQSGGEHRLVALHRLLTSTQDPQNAKALAAVGKWSAPRFHAIEELAALIPQRLRHYKGDGLGFCLHGIPEAILPLDAVGVQHQLFGCRVVEDRHLIGTDNDQALFLERVKPTHENVGADAVREAKLAERYVGDVLA